MFYNHLHLSIGKLIRPETFLHKKKLKKYFKKNTFQGRVNFKVAVYVLCE